MRKHWLMALVLIGAAGCPDIEVDENEVGTAGPQVEFDPAGSVIPFPNNLLIDPATGLVNLPAQCNETPTSKALREQVLNKLDGFGTYEVGIQATFTEPVDMASLEGRVVLYKRVAETSAVDPGAAQPVPVMVLATTTQRASADCSMTAPVSAVQIVPLVPLEQKSIYTVALLSGIKTTEGADFGPAFTWALIRQANPPVVVDAEGHVTVNRTPLDPTNPTDLAQLQGIALLWNAHAQALAFLEAKGVQRDDVLLAWEFKTQTTTDPLDPMVAGSPAANVYKDPALQVGSLTATIDRTMAPYVLCDAPGGGPGTDNNVQCFLKIALGGAAGVPANQVYATGNALCAQVGCANVGEVLGGAFKSKQYTTDTPNAFDPSTPFPGPWTDPRMPAAIKDELLQFIAFVPATPPPSSGFPTVVYGHGLGSSKETLLAIGPQLATPRTGFPTGFVSVGIDFVGHGSRAVRISDDAALGCSGDPAPTSSPQCFAPFLSTNLAATRDGIRQSVLDLQGEIEMLKACGASACAATATGAGSFKIDPAHISYLGISLGSLIGATAVATKPELPAGVLNVGGAGWIDILENTETLAIRCGLVDGLIDAGVLVGDKFDPGQNTGLCTTDAWQDQPGYQQFRSIARWVIDPADAANFARMLAGRKTLLQEVVGDMVVPNIATDRFGALLGLTPLTADPALSQPVVPSAAITTDPTTQKFVKYPSFTTPAPGNTFVHSSLLRPANNNADGILGTARLQTDAITYLIFNR
jgi:hypothetical protein